MGCYYFVTISCIFFTSLFAQQEKPLVIISCSYNVEQWVEKRLDSILRQKYANYRVVCVDDASIDGTAQKIAQYIKKHNLSATWELVVSKKRTRKLAHWYREIHRCKDNEIVLLLDGDDWLFGDNVFQIINEIYSTTDTWFTYGQYKNEPVYEAQRWGFKERGYAKPILSKVEKLHNYRNHMFIFMHLRTFYTALFKKIRLQDLITKTVDGFVDDFFPASNDLAIVFPMVEMAYGHVTFVPDIVYVRNVYSDLVGFKIDNHLQISGSREIRKKEKYKPLKKIFGGKKLSKNIDALVFVDDASGLLKTLHSVYKYASEIKKIVVAYNKDNLEKIDKELIYKSVQSCSNVTLVSFDEQNKDTVASFVQKHLSDYVLCLKSSQQLTQNINLKKCYRWLTQTHADGWLLGDGVVQGKIQLAKDVVCSKPGVNHDLWPKIIRKKNVSLVTQTKKDVLFLLNRK